MEELLNNFKHITDQFFEQADEFVKQQKGLSCMLRCEDCDCKFQGIYGETFKCDRCYKESNN